MRALPFAVMLSSLVYPCSSFAGDVSQYQPSTIALNAKTDSVVDRSAKADPGSCEDRPCAQDDRLGGNRPPTIVSNDRKSRYVSLIINKSIALEMSRDVTDVFVANPAIANAVLRSNRRAYVIAKQLGQTNVYFYDAQGRQIEGLNLNIGEDHEIQEVKLEQIVTVVQGQRDKDAIIKTFTCGSGFCSQAEYAKTEKPPPQPIIVLPNVTSLPTAPATK
jgi:Pilus formation protein N terminal region